MIAVTKEPAEIHQNTSSAPFVGIPLSPGLRLTVVTLGWLACVTGVFGNVLIIATLLSQQALRSVHNIYIANLAVADLLVVGYVVVFWLLDLVLGYQPVVNEAHCEVNAYLLSVCCGVSVYTLALIAVNRYVRVCWTTHYPRLFSRRRTVTSCLVLWLGDAIFRSFAFTKQTGSNFRYDPKVHFCDMDSTANFHLVFAMIGIFVPACIVGFVSVAILRVWKKSKNRIGVWSRVQNQPAPNYHSRTAHIGGEGCSRESACMNQNSGKDRQVLQMRDSSHFNQFRSTAPCTPSARCLINGCSATAPCTPSSAGCSGTKSVNQASPRSDIYFVNEALKTRANTFVQKGTSISEGTCLKRDSTNREGTYGIQNSPAKTGNSADRDLQGKQAVSMVHLRVPQLQKNRASRTRERTSFNPLKSNVPSTGTIPFSPSEPSDQLCRGHSGAKWASTTSRNGQTQNLRQTSRMKRRISSSDIALIRSLVAVFGFLIILNIPIGIAIALELRSSAIVSADAYAFLVLLTFCNNSINWIIYGLMNRAFREGYKQLMALISAKVLWFARDKIPECVASVRMHTCRQTNR